MNLYMILISYYILIEAIELFYTYNFYACLQPKIMNWLELVSAGQLFPILFLLYFMDSFTFFPSPLSFIYHWTVSSILTYIWLTYTSQTDSLEITPIVVIYVIPCMSWKRQSYRSRAAEKIIFSSSCVSTSGFGSLRLRKIRLVFEKETSSARR